jgi:hypothetical protein
VLARWSSIPSIMFMSFYMSNFKFKRALSAARCHAGRRGERRARGSESASVALRHASAAAGCSPTARLTACRQRREHSSVYAFAVWVGGPASK